MEMDTETKTDRQTYVQTHKYRKIDRRTHIHGDAHTKQAAFCLRCLRVLSEIQKLKMKSVWPREPGAAKMSPGSHSGANGFYFGPLGPGKAQNKIRLPQGTQGSQNEPRGAKVEKADFITGRWGLEKLKINSVWPREPRGAKMSPGEPKWSKRILLQAARAMESSK